MLPFFKNLLVAYLRARMEELKSKISELKESINQFATEEKNKAETFRIRFLGSSGLVKKIMGEMRNVAPENRKQAGLALNALKQFAEEKYNHLKIPFHLRLKELPIIRTLHFREMSCRRAAAIPSVL